MSSSRRNCSRYAYVFLDLLFHTRLANVVPDMCWSRWSNGNVRDHSAINSVPVFLLSLQL